MRNCAPAGKMYSPASSPTLIQVTPLSIDRSISVTTPPTTCARHGAVAVYTNGDALTVTACPGFADCMIGGCEYLSRGMGSRVVADVDDRSCGRVDALERCQITVVLHRCADREK